jgi:mannose-6-phosphate isomerase class I
MPKSTPFYIIPLLVEQPTWGGNYIAQFKDIRNTEIAERKIGQSFELFGESFITYTPSSAPAFAWATATNLKNPEFVNRPADIQTLQSVIDGTPLEILGKKALQKHGATMKVLIKFTQAQNNSYQVHVQTGKEFGKWLAKPESWFYFEEGKATLGLNTNTKVEDYKTRCIEIDAKAQELSTAALNQKISVVEARDQLKSFIDQNHPRQYVNTIQVKKGQVIDLSQGGIHHSWEMDPLLPNGNIVYEVQVDVMDEFCTLRSFDQGNIKDDGKIRPITIEDYFTALDTDAQRNSPTQYEKEAQSHNDQDATVTPLFNNQFYTMTQLSFTGRYGGLQTENKDSFHHLFVQEGRIEVVTDGGRWPVEKGWSILVPAEIEGYQLNSNGKSVVLRTCV